MAELSKSLGRSPGFAGGVASSSLKSARVDPRNSKLVGECPEIVRVPVFWVTMGASDPAHGKVRVANQYSRATVDGRLASYFRSAFGPNQP